MTDRSARVYEFGDFRLDRGKRLLLRRDGTPVPLTPKAFDTLTYLVEHTGHVLDKEELMRAVWPDTAVEENNLNQNISLLRRALGEGRRDHRYIATMPGHGYQFLEKVSVAAATAAQNQPPVQASIAVLPFVNVSADPNDEYFGDGLADDLITALSKLDRVRVAARTSAFSFKGRRADVREIANKLAVSFVLEGSVRRVGTRLRVTAQLVNAADGYQLWSERYDRETEMRDIFDVQDEITLAVLDALKVSLPGRDTSAVFGRSRENVKAHELYLKGRFHLFRMTQAGIEAGMRHFEQAIEEDPSYALAHVGLAHAYRMFGLSLEMDPRTIAAKAKAAALRALEVDDTLAEAHAVLAFNLFWYEWAWDAAGRHFKDALRLNANSADTHWMYAHLLSNLGRPPEPLTGIGRARALDPLSGLINAMEGQFLLHAGRTDEAIARLRDAIELEPRSRVAHLFAASAFIEKGMFGEAAAEARTARGLTPSNTQALALEAYANARGGQRPEAEEALAQLLQLSKERYVSPYNVAIACNGLNESTQAIAWLERGFEQHDPMMVFLYVEPKWRNLRGEPRVIRLLTRMKFL